MYSLSDGPNACSLEIMTSIKVVRVQLSCNDFLFARTLRDMQNHHMCLNSHDKKVLRIFLLLRYITFARARFFGRMHRHRLKHICLHQTHT